MFPSDFDLNIYRKNEDLQFLNNELLEKHYEENGKNEGRICSKISNRSKLIEYIDTDKFKCLEIGPFDCPNLKGEKVNFFDVLDQDSLKKRALQLNRMGEVPYIDHVDSKGNLRIIDDKFDVVLSCHSIEHQLNFIQHIVDVSELLNDNGYYVIIVPDKRYCFDHFIKETTIADIICQHINKPALHSIKSVIEHRVLTCHNDCIRHWHNDHGKQNYFYNKNSILDAVDEYQNSISNNQYLDVHSLQFTPDSFKDIINLLNQLNYIDLVIDNVYSTIQNSCEFYVTLKKVTK